MARKTTFIDFEKSLQELEALVESLEKGDLSLEDSLKAFERGIALTRACQTTLKAAEQKVEILSARDDQAVPQAFEPVAKRDDRD